MDIYNNNGVEITAERVDVLEMKINVNGENLICIESSKYWEFKQKLSSLLDEYRI